MQERRSLPVLGQALQSKDLGSDCSKLTTIAGKQSKCDCYNRESNAALMYLNCSASNQPPRMTTLWLDQSMHSKLTAGTPLSDAASVGFLPRMLQARTATRVYLLPDELHCCGLALQQHSHTDSNPQKHDMHTKTKLNSCSVLQSPGLQVLIPKMESDCFKHPKTSPPPLCHRTSILPLPLPLHPQHHRTLVL